MSTLHLVDLSARDVAAGFAPFDPAHETVEQFRATVNSMYASDPVAHEERIVPGPAGAPDVRVLIYRPETAIGKVPAILYFHGGGLIAGKPDMMGSASLKLARDSGAVVIAVQYRLAPESPFPDPVEDCYAALTWLFGQAEALGVDSARIAVLGHSAGAGLAAALALLARDRGDHALKAQFLVYPMLDPRTGTADAPVDNPTSGEFLWSRAANSFGWDAMRGKREIPPERIGHFAPALAEDVAAMPPTFIAVGSLDLFLEEDVAYALRLSRAGVLVEAHIYPGGIHGFDAFPGQLSDAFQSDLRAAIARFL